MRTVYFLIGEGAFLALDCCLQTLPPPTVPFLFKITLWLWGSAVGLNCLLPSSLALSATCQTSVPHSGVHWHAASELSISFHLIVHMEDSFPTWPLNSLVFWTFPLQASYPFSLPPCHLKHPCLKNHSFKQPASAPSPNSPSISLLLSQLLQSPRTARSMMSPFIQPVSSSLSSFTFMALHFNDSLDNIPNSLPLHISSFIPVWQNRNHRWAQWFVFFRILIWELRSIEESHTTRTRLPLLIQDH